MNERGKPRRFSSPRLALAIAGTWSAGILSMGCGLPLGQTPIAGRPDSGAVASAEGSGESQASYRVLDIADASAWAAATQAGSLRAGALLVKTGPGFDPAVLAGLGAVENGSIAMAAGTWRHLSVPAGSERTIALALRSKPGVLSVSPEQRLRLPAGEISSASLASGAVARSLGTSALDDPYVGSAEYSLAITHAVDAYATGAYALGSKVAYAAVIDTGIDLAHEDFNANPVSIVVRAMSAFTRDANGTTYTYVGDGQPFVAVQAGANWDDDGHGTHVSGIVGALGNNGKGMAGVMWSSLKLVSYKVITDHENTATNGSGGDWAVFGALKDLADWWSNSGAYATTTQHADATQVTMPVNMSLGSPGAGPFEMEVLAYALKKNVLVCASMGNDGRTTAEYPAAYTGVIAVGATDGADNLAAFSTRGPWMSVCAPGFDIISTFNGSSSDYEWDSGTSMAAPFVTGLAAYLLAFKPSLAPDQVKTIIEESADRIGGASGYSPEFGWGRVNVKAALDLATGSSTPLSGSVYATGDLIVTLTSSSSATYTTGQPVYLYDSAGGFVEVGLTGDAGTDATAAGLASSAGSVRFSLLKPGSYTAITTIGGTAYRVTATLGSSGDASATIKLP